MEIIPVKLQFGSLKLNPNLVKPGLESGRTFHSSDARWYCIISRSGSGSTYFRVNRESFPGQHSFIRFPSPRQHWIDVLALSDDQLAALPQDFLIIHGREDKVIPVGCSIALSERIDRAQLHVFSHCGHWVQLEQSERFHRLVENFLDE